MTPTVSVIVPHHLNENDRYLALTLEGLSRTEGVDIEVLVVSDAKTKPGIHSTLDSDKFTLYWDQNVGNASQKVDFAYPKTHPGSKHIMFVSDDVVVSKHTIRGLVEAAADRPHIINPMTNGEMGSRFFTDLYLTKADGTKGALKVHHSIEDVQGWEEAIFNFPMLKTILIPEPMVPFCCTLIPRKTWDIIGKLDERLDSRHNDEDYCIRARQNGIMSLIHLGVFALHFGSKTLNKSVTKEEQNEATRVFMEKWGVK